MAILIPATFRYEQNDYSLGGKPLELDDSSMGADPMKNDLFVAMLKYIVSPFSTKNYYKVEDDLKHFLDSKLLERAAEENDNMEFNSDEYEKHKEYAWRELSELTMEEFFKYVRPFIAATKDDYKDFDEMRRAMSQKGNTTTLINILDTLGEQHIMTAHTMKDAQGTRLWAAGENKEPFGPALKRISNIVNDDENIKNTIHEELKVGDNKYMELQVRDIPLNKLSSTRYIIINIDFEKLFKDIMLEQGVDMPMQKLVAKPDEEDDVSHTGKDERRKESETALQDELDRVKGE